jgi:subtilisin family serine protease
MLVAIAAIGVASALPFGAAQAQGRSERALNALRNPGYSHVPGEVLVQFRRGMTEVAKDDALRGMEARFDTEVKSGRDRSDGNGDLDLVKLPPGLAVADAVRALAARGDVDYVEPNWVYRHQVVSNDALYTNGSLWGMYGDASSPANAFGSQAAEAWARGADCGNVVVGIIDEGVMITHPDLAPNIWTNPGEIPGNGIDDDGNGFIDDTNGWDFAGNNRTVYDGTADDHGTHVAGTIGAVGGNAAGVAGVCWSVKMIPVKFLGANGGTTANAIRAIDYLIDLKRRHNLNLVATNNSWGGGGFSQALADAIERANAAGILFVAAAGNNASNNDAVANFPSNYTSTNVIAVASITSTGALSSFSNFGASTVDIGAPGSAIWSTVPGRRNSATYASYSGTSMATPHVTGAAALWASRNPFTSIAQVKAAILNSAVFTPSLNGRVVTNGRLNVQNF